jgi:ABC-type glycerol-3-phosphate transport system permease component
MSAIHPPIQEGVTSPRTKFKLIPALWKMVLYIVLLIGAAIMLFPLFWMLSTSFKTQLEANASKIIWLPQQIQLAAYKTILANKDFLIAYGNSIFVTAIALVGTVVTIALVAYAFSRLEWPGRNIVFFMMLATLMIPAQSLAVPQYMIFLKFKWVGTFNPIVIPGFFAGGAAMIFLLRQFMAQIPKELDEAAHMDGANHLQIWWYVILPLCRPAIATISALLFVGIWNSLLYPLIFLTSTKLYTLPIFVTTLYNPQMPSQPWPTIMAASVLTALPLLLIFFFAQRYLIESIVLSGTKG